MMSADHPIVLFLNMLSCLKMEKKQTEHIVGSDIFTQRNTEQGIFRDPSIVSRSDFSLVVQIFCPILEPKSLDALSEVSCCSFPYAPSLSK